MNSSPQTSSLISAVPLLGWLIRYLQGLPETRTALLIVKEARRNPYWPRALRTTPALTGRGLFIALALFFVSVSAALVFRANSVVISPWAILFFLYIPARLILIHRAASRAASQARLECATGNCEHLYLSPLLPRQLAAGWALLGWSRAAGETLMTFALLYPWLAPHGFAWAAAPLVEVVHLVMLQGLAAVVAAKCVCSHTLRREATSAGWATASITHPIVLFAQSMVVSLFFVLVIGFLVILPVSILLMLAASGLSGIDAWDPATLFFWVVPVMLGSYIVWLPIGVFQEIDRQLNSESISSERFRKHLEPKS